MNQEDKKRRRLASSNKWRLANMEKVRAAARNRYWKNRDEFIAAGKKWREENREKSRISARHWQSENMDKLKSDHAKWRMANSDRRCAKQSQRKASKVNATPVWANEFFINEAYNLAALRSKIMGFKWHVDHIVPLKSDLVCGLHAHTNIQVIPAAQNISKHNRYWPDMP